MRKTALSTHSTRGVPRTHVGNRAENALPTRYITIPQAAKYLGVTDRTIRAMIGDGRLTAHRLGNRFVRLRIDEIDAAFNPSGGAAQ